MKKVLKPFKFGTMKTAADFEKTMTEAGLPFPVDENVDILAKPIQIGDKIVPNRLCIQPLEGFDGEPDGSPSDLIRRRYKRYAGGGAGMIWYESIAISEDGRCNPLQMVIRPSTVQSIREMVEEANAEAIDAAAAAGVTIVGIDSAGHSDQVAAYIGTDNYGAGRRAARISLLRLKVQQQRAGDGQNDQREEGRR